MIFRYSDKSVLDLTADRCIGPVYSMSQLPKKINPRKLYNMLASDNVYNVFELVQGKCERILTKLFLSNDDTCLDFSFRQIGFHRVVIPFLVVYR